MTFVATNVTTSPNPNPDDNPGASWEAIIHAINYRRTYRGEIINEMVRVREIYNGHWVIPMMELDGEPDSRPAIPDLIGQAIDGPADRAASVSAMLYSPAFDPAAPNGKGSKAWADIRRRAVKAGWYFSGVDEVVLPRSYRHYQAYGAMCGIVRPDFKAGRARIENRDPLQSYPDLTHEEVTEVPENVGFLTYRSRAWLMQNYGQSHPEVMSALWNSNRDNSDIFEMIEWIDRDWYVIGVVGPRYFNVQSSAFPSWPVGGFELRRWPNRAGVVPVSMPYRVTLDKIMGAVNKIVPIVNKMAKLDLLEYFSAEKAVFPDLVVMGKDGTPQLVGGAWKDGRTGEANIVENGDVKYLSTTPGLQTQQRIDQLERAARQTSGNPAMFGGEPTGNIRSGQTVNALAATSVDPNMQAMQRIGARFMSQLSDAYMAVERGWFGGRKIFSVSGFAQDQEIVEYIPNRHFERDSQIIVSYPFPGLDASQISVAVSQLVGAGLASKADGRAIHPLIPDAIATERQITIERLEDALLAGLVTQMQTPDSGGAQPVDGVAAIKALKQGKTLEEAIESAHKAAQVRQSTMAPPPGPGQMTSPDAQPGLSPPGVGSEQPQGNPLLGGAGQGMPSPIGGQIAPDSPDQENLKQIMRAIRANSPAGAQ